VNNKNAITDETSHIKQLGGQPDGKSAIKL